MNRTLAARLARLEDAEPDPLMAELEKLTDAELRALIVDNCHRRLADPTIDEQERADVLADLADEEGALDREYEAMQARYQANGGPWFGYYEESIDLGQRRNAAADAARARRKRAEERVRAAEMHERMR
jgi:hypothetical protein